MTDLFEGSPHRPVLYQEVIQALQPIRSGRYVDCTLGAGGHAWGILQDSSPDGELLGLEVDPQAMQAATERLAQFGERIHLMQASYVTLGEQLNKLGWETVNGVLLDLGLSSMQLDTPNRGFSFLQDAPLDMRFDPRSPVCAADLVNHLPEAELAQVLYRYGEEPHAQRIARAIVRARPIHTTVELAGLVAREIGKARVSSSRGQRSKNRTHPATRTFQALRIAVNRELESLENVLPQAVAALAPGGMLAVISFHSLEDRIVKQFVRQESRDCICPPRQPVCTCGHQASLVEITRHPLRPQMAEVLLNPRSRSARLRVAEKLANNSAER
jgi:16S rRNA (cytosine1402-N4)-methyltransferase